MKPDSLVDNKTHYHFHGDYNLERDKRAEQRGNKAKERIEVDKILYLQSPIGKKVKSPPREEIGGAPITWQC